MIVTRDKDEYVLQVRVYEVRVTLEPFKVLITWNFEECGASIPVTVLYIRYYAQCKMTTLKKYGKTERKKEGKER
jgi:hypothetical protein